MHEALSGRIKNGGAVIACERVIRGAAYDQGPPIFRGVFENNDPTKRLMVMINFNTDVSNYWEYSAMGFRPIDESNEAYKLGVNYLFYALTH